MLFRDRQKDSFTFPEYHLLTGSGLAPSQDSSMLLSVLNEIPPLSAKQPQADRDSTNQTKSSKLIHSWSKILPNPGGFW